MSEPAVDEFAAALRELYQAAGSPTLGQLVHQGRQQRPSVRLSDSSISAWLAGKAVPADPDAIRFVIGYLGSRITPDSQYRPPRPDWWTTAYARARTANQASRGGRPTRPRPDDTPATRLGQPIAACDPIALEIHPAITVSGQQANTLPVYVTRPHDARLDELAAQAVAGSSRMITLVGGSSTGKTRACWELIQRLEAQQPGRWRVWHPYDPTRPEAAAAVVDQAGPDTIIWLNEAQFYLAPSDPRLGEQIAAGLRTVLRGPDRGPVLILATLWPEHWTTLTARPDVGLPDPHSQARELLTSTDIDVPDTFTTTDLAGLRDASDARLQHAADHSENGRITQYLAGAPELENRYRKAPPAARAIIDVAIDARRLGHRPAIPHILLAQAVPGYLDDHEWDHLGDDWLEQALAYTARPCHGARGPLTRIRPRSGNADGQPVYRLADYLEQTGRVDRAATFPPASFWYAAAATITDSAFLLRLGWWARWRGRYHRAVQLYQVAADLGDASARRALVELLEQGGNQAGAEKVVVQAADRGETDALWHLAQQREKAGDTTGAEALYQVAVDRGDATAVLRSQAQTREQAGDRAGAETMYLEARDLGHPAARRDLVRLREKAGDTTAVIAHRFDEHSRLWHLARRREQAGDATGAEMLYGQLADRGDNAALRALAKRRENAGDAAGAEALYQQLANRNDSSALRDLSRLQQDRKGGETGAVWSLTRAPQSDRDQLHLLVPELSAGGSENTDQLCHVAKLLQQTGDTIGAEQLLRQAADRDSTDAMCSLAWLQLQKGDPDGAEHLLQQAVDRGHKGALRYLAERRERAGDQIGAERLALQAAKGGRTTVLLGLAWLRKRAGDITGAEEVLRRAADHGDNAALRNLAELREQSGDHAAAEAFARQAANRGNDRAIRDLTKWRERAGLHADAEAVASNNPYALWDLARLREQAGDTRGAESLYQQAANRGIESALRELAKLRERAGDISGAEESFRQAVNRGDIDALRDLARLRKQIGDPTSSDHIRTFGLSDDGTPAASLELTTQADPPRPLGVA